MGRAVLITAFITSAVFPWILCIVYPEILHSSYFIVAISAYTALLFAFTGFLIGRKIKNKYDNRFRAFLEGLDVVFTSYYNTLYAYGTFQGLHVSFKYGRITENDLAPDMPDISRSTILCRFKIPETGNTQIHLAVIAESRNRAIRKALGWENPEHGFYLSKKMLNPPTNGMVVFRKLSAYTREKLRSIAARTGSVSITPDWETIMIGRENALVIVGGDEVLLSLLDLQAKLSTDLSTGERDLFLGELRDAVTMISRDLR